MSYASKVLDTGDGATTNFTFTFPYLSSTHVEVYVNGTKQLNPMNYTLSGSVVSFGTAPADGAEIEIKRNTSPNTILVDFIDGSVLNENDLDTAYLHNFYRLQEVTDGFNQLVNEALVAVATGAGIVETDTDEVIAALVNEMLADANVQNLQDRIADIDANGEAIITASDSLQTQLNTLAQGIAATVYVQTTEPVPGVGGVPDPIPDGARWYDSDDNNHPYIYDQAGAQWLDLEDPRIAANQSAITTLQADLMTAQGDISGNSSLISTLNATVYNGSTGVVANASAITQLQSDVGTNSSDITTEQTTRASADSALASDVALLGAHNGTQDAFILDSSTVKIDSDSGDTIAARLSALQSSINGNAADIVTEQSVRASGDSANASDISFLSATVSGHTSSISTNASAIASNDGDITDLYAKYGVTLNVNGYITGFAQNNDGTTGSFVILADKFAVVDPSGDPGETQYTPFSVSSGTVYMNDVVAREVHYGQTAFDTGTGYWIGNVSGTPKLSIGNSSGNKLTWDGSTLSVVGDLKWGNTQTFSITSPVGWTSGTDPSGDIAYIDLGTHVLLWLPETLGGTSDSTLCQWSGMPSAIRPTNNMKFDVLATDNGQSRKAVCTIHSTGTMSFELLEVTGSQLHEGTNSWTASNPKSIHYGNVMIYPKT